MFTRKMTLLASLLAILVGCGGGGDSASNNTQNTDEDALAVCSTEWQRDYVYETMQDWYLWYDEIPELDPFSFATNDDLLEATVAPAIQARGKGFPYSYLTTVEEEEALLNNAGYIGFGFSSQLNDAEDAFILREVFPGSPSDTAGLIRSDAIIAIDGVPVSQLLAEGAFDQDPGPYGPAEIDHTVKLTIEHQSGVQEDIDVSKDEVEIPTVSYVTTFDANSDGTDETGYIYFRSFLTPSTGELNTAFQQLKDKGGISKLVLDLRYNGGGLVSVADHLANLIAGGQYEGELFSKTVFNDKKSVNNSAAQFAEETLSLPITHVVAITTGGTASSSELIINGLKPYVTVATVGSTSYGKPVGQIGNLRFCGNILRAVAFETVNKNDVGDYYVGIEPGGTTVNGYTMPGCKTEDDLTAELGVAGEASLDAALQYLDDGSCPAASPKMGGSLKSYVDRSTSTYRDGRDLMTGGIR